MTQKRKVDTINNMFKKEIKLKEEEKKLYITVSIEKRTYINQKRLTFEEDILKIIPEQYKEKVTMVSKPNYKISNFTRNNHQQSGTWIFEIKTENEEIKNEKPAKPTANTRRRKTRTSRTKKD